MMNILSDNTSTFNKEEELEELTPTVEHEPELEQDVFVSPALMLQLKKTKFGGYAIKSVNDYITRLHAEQRQVREQMEKQIEGLLAEKRTVAQECDFLHDRIKESESNLQSAKAQLKTMFTQEQMDALKEKLGTAETELAQANEQLQILDETRAERDHLESVCADNASMIEQLESSYSQSVQEQDRLNKQIRVLEVALKGSKADVSEQIQSLLNENHDLDVDNCALRQKIDSYDNVVAVTVAEREEFDRSVQEMEQAREELQAWKEQMDRDQLNIEQDMQSISEKISELEDREAEIQRTEEKQYQRGLALRDTEQTLSDRESQLQADRSKIEHREAQIQEAVRHLTEKGQELEEKETQLQSKESQMQSMQSELEQRLSSLSEAEASVAEKETAVRSAEADLTQREAALEQAQELLTEKENQLMSAQNELAQRELAVQEQFDSLEQREESLRKLEDDLGQRELAVQEQSDSLEQREESLRKLEDDLGQRELAVQQQSDSLEQREESLRKHEDDLGQRELAVQQQSDSLEQREESIRKHEDDLDRRELNASQLENDLNERESSVRSSEEAIAERELFLRNSTESLSQRESQLHEAQVALQQRENTVQELEDAMSQKLLERHMENAASDELDARQLVESLEILPQLSEAHLPAADSSTLLNSDEFDFASPSQAEIQPVSVGDAHAELSESFELESSEVERMTNEPQSPGYEAADSRELHSTNQGRISELEAENDRLVKELQQIIESRASKSSAATVVHVEPVESVAQQSDEEENPMQQTPDALARARMILQKMKEDLSK